MRIRGLQLFRSLLRGSNTTVLLRQTVIKRLAGPDARRRFCSEVMARPLLSQIHVDTVPILARVPAVHTIVMPRAGRTVNQHLSPDVLRAFEDHVVDVCGRTVEKLPFPGYGWLDSPDRARRFDSFADFLLTESAADARDLLKAASAIDENSVLSILRAAQPFPDRILVLTDVAPKNVVYSAGRFSHLDLEVTLIGPPEFLLVKAATNLATDVGDQHEARVVRDRLLAHCASAENARAALVFSLVRRIAYEVRRNRRDPRAAAALTALIEGGGLAEAITLLERTPDTRSQPAADRAGA